MNNLLKNSYIYKSQLFNIHDAENKIKKMVENYKNPY